MQSMSAAWSKRRAGIQTALSQALGLGWNSVIPTSSLTLPRENEASFMWSEFLVAKHFTLLCIRFCLTFSGTFDCNLKIITED